MFGSRVRAPRPVLLILVYGAFLAVVGAAATAQSILVGAHFNSATLTSLVGSDAATVRAFVNAYVPPADLSPARSLSASEVGRLEAQLATLPRPGEILRVEIRRADGTIVAGSEPGMTGTATPDTAETQAALTGQAQAAIGPAAEAGAGSATLASPTVLRELLPLKVGHEVLGVVGVWRDAVPILARLEDMRRAILLVTVSAGMVAAALLFLVFRSAQARLSRQTEALLESTRRDSLTDTPNHGALVGLLAQAIERGRDDVRPIGIALIDIDNFRLLNDNHGHAAGDEALLAVAGTLRTSIDPAIEFGRYGPDEFLLIAPPTAVAHLERVIERLRAALVDLSLRFDETERLPVTVSVGIATYPDHASSATGLLAAAVGVLEEAKASGGDTVRFAGDGEQDASTANASFDVLQGLVTAIDTKDRYTKRHSEDVARYATFIGRRLGLAAEELHTIDVAGRLHDIGKIGIPDVILRKPGSLTEAEYAIVQQHVALGDMIVRDLPDIDAVRAGIRHHHERWDGNGYLDHLEGDAIPRIARILAVADAFSAMTTTRPYRKALDVREALARLGDAAGSQLDELLVAAFIEGIEHDADPPLPGDVAGATIIAHPRRVA